MIENVDAEYLEEVITEEFSNLIDVYMSLDIPNEPVVNDLLDLRSKIYERLGINE